MQTMITIWQYILPFIFVIVPNHCGFVGSLKEHTDSYFISGDIFILDSNTIQIKAFNYNGQGPDAFFYVGTWDKPGSKYGIKIDYPSDTPDEKLGSFSRQDIILKMPPGLQTWDLKWISVWCRRFAVNFASAVIGKGNPTAALSEKVQPTTTPSSLESVNSPSNEQESDFNLSNSITSLLSLLWVCLSIIFQFRMDV